MLSGQIYVRRIRKWYSFPKQRQYRKRINNWPKVLPNDGHSLRKLTNFLQHCLMAMNTVEYLNMLNDQKKKTKDDQKAAKLFGDEMKQDCRPIGLLQIN